MNQNSDYLEALKYSGQIQPEGAGFSKTAGANLTGLNEIAVKQNNTILGLLVLLTERVNRLEDRIQHLEGQKSSSTEDILVKLENLSLGKVERKKEAKGVLRVREDPYKSLEKETKR